MIEQEQPTFEVGDRFRIMRKCKVMLEHISSTPLPDGGSHVVMSYVSHPIGLRGVITAKIPLWPDHDHTLYRITLAAPFEGTDTILLDLEQVAAKATRLDDSEAQP